MTSCSIPKKHNYKSLGAAGTQLRWLDCLIRLCLFTRGKSNTAYALFMWQTNNKHNNRKELPQSSARVAGNPLPAP